MSSQKEARQRELSEEELNDLIVDSMQDIKAKNIVKLDLRKIEDSSTDFFIICEGDSTTQVKSISDNIYQRLKSEGHTLPVHHEGQQNSLWILLDYFSTVVHVFYRETRAFYELEDLWGDAISTEYHDL